MIAAWMAYAILVAAAVGFAAFGLERLLRTLGRPTRTAWTAGMTLAIAIPVYAWMTPPEPIASAPVTIVLGPVDAVASVAPRAATLTDRLAALNTPLLAGWAAATLLLVGALASSRLHLRRTVAAASPATIDGVDVRVTDDFGPAVVGRRIVAVPRWVTTLRDDWQRLVVRHEREHLEAGDDRLLLGAVAAAVLVPWNPVLWWLLHRLRQAIEVDCDHRLMRAGVDVDTYTALLLDVAARPHRGALAVAAFGRPRSLLARRILTMVHTPQPMSRARRGVLAAFATLALAAACETPIPAAVDFDDEAGTVTSVSQVFAESDLEKLPERLSGPPVRYPEMLRQAGVEGSVLLEFVIDEEGRVDETSIETLERTNRAFEGPARDVIARSLFTPGEIEGRAVATVARQRIAFRMDRGERERTIQLLGNDSVAVRLDRSEGGNAIYTLGSEKLEVPVLVMLDGRPVGDDEFMNLSPDAIERIEVFRGAAARERSGRPQLIQITTKQKALDDIVVTARGNR